LANLAPINEINFMLRVAAALLIGVIIGGEREAKNKPAGLRTNMLVSLGSALFVLVPIQLGMATQTPDTLARTISGIISGVGFIGAGTILRKNDARVKGLTSASAIWVSASLGIAVGCGLWIVSLVGTIAAWIVLRLFKHMEHLI
jgi:putative Mg2+ transporter-C (MgtC) family protein